MLHQQQHQHKHHLTHLHQHAHPLILQRRPFLPPQHTLQHNLKRLKIRQPKQVLTPQACHQAQHKLIPDLQHQALHQIGPLFMMVATLMAIYNSLT